MRNMSVKMLSDGLHDMEFLLDMILGPTRRTGWDVAREDVCKMVEKGLISALVSTLQRLPAHGLNTMHKRKRIRDAVIATQRIDWMSIAASRLPAIQKEVKEALDHFMISLLNSHASSESSEVLWKVACVDCLIRSVYHSSNNCPGDASSWAQVVKVVNAIAPLIIAQAIDDQNHHIRFVDNPWSDFEEQEYRSNPFTLRWALARPDILTRANKHTYVRQLSALIRQRHRGVMILSSRTNILEELCRWSEQGAGLADDDVQFGLTVQLHGIGQDGAEGLDGVGPGALKQWFSLVVSEFTDLRCGLFKIEDGPFFPNPSSGVANADHLSYFEVVGRIIGLSLLHNQPIGVYFSPVLCSYLLNGAQLFEFEQMKLLDASLFQNLKVVGNTDDPETLDKMGLTFAVNEDLGGFNKAAATQVPKANIHSG